MDLFFKKIQKLLLAVSIKDGLIDKLEYDLVPDEAWKVLVEEFGLADGQLPISRKVIGIFSFEIIYFIILK